MKPRGFKTAKFSANSEKNRWRRDDGSDAVFAISAAVWILISAPRIKEWFAYSKNTSAPITIAHERRPLSYSAAVSFFSVFVADVGFFVKVFPSPHKVFFFSAEKIFVFLASGVQLFQLYYFKFVSGFSLFFFVQPLWIDRIIIKNGMYCPMSFICSYWQRNFFCYTKTGSKGTFVLLLLPAVRFVPWKQNKSVSCKNAAEIISRARLPAGTLT